jgi:hypothetical protein
MTRFPIMGLSQALAGSQGGRKKKPEDEEVPAWSDLLFRKNQQQNGPAYGDLLFRKNQQSPLPSFQLLSGLGALGAALGSKIPQYQFSVPQAPKAPAPAWAPGAPTVKAPGPQWAPGATTTPAPKPMTAPKIPTPTAPQLPPYGTAPVAPPVPQTMQYIPKTAPQIPQPGMAGRFGGMLGNALRMAPALTFQNSGAGLPGAVQRMLPQSLAQSQAIMDANAQPIVPQAPVQQPAPLPVPPVPPIAPATPQPMTDQASWGQVPFDPRAWAENQPNYSVIGQNQNVPARPGYQGNTWNEQQGPNPFGSQAMQLGDIFNRMKTLLAPGVILPTALDRAGAAAMNPQTPSVPGGKGSPEHQRAMGILSDAEKRAAGKSKGLPETEALVKRLQATQPQNTSGIADRAIAGSLYPSPSGLPRGQTDMGEGNVRTRNGPVMWNDGKSGAPAAKPAFDKGRADALTEKWSGIGMSNKPDSLVRDWETLRKTEGSDAGARAALNLRNKIGTSSGVSWNSTPEQKAKTYARINESRRAGNERLALSKALGRPVKPEMVGAAWNEVNDPLQRALRTGGQPAMNALAAVQAEQAKAQAESGKYAGKGEEADMAYELQQLKIRREAMGNRESIDESTKAVRDQMEKRKKSGIKDSGIGSALEGGMPISSIKDPVTGAIKNKNEIAGWVGSAYSDAATNPVSAKKAADELKISKITPEDIDNEIYKLDPSKWSAASRVLPGSTNPGYYDETPADAKSARKDALSFVLPGLINPSLAAPGLFRKAAELLLIGRETPEERATRKKRLSTLEAIRKHF